MIENKKATVACATSRQCDAAPQARLAATLVPSRGLAATPHLQAFLPECARLVRRRLPAGGIDSVAGPGSGPQARYAQALARRLEAPYLALEDGFLRSVGQARDLAPTMSLLVDDLGVHYDARSASRLETILETGALDDPALLARGQAAIEKIIAAGLSQTNTAKAQPLPAPTLGHRRILVVDQRNNDPAIAGAMADAASFKRMLEAARDEARGGEVLVLRAPETAAGRNRGALPMELPPGVTDLGPERRAADILAGVDAVYTVSSLVGMEALIRGLPVRCFGLPFYAGWGATSDERATPRRTRRLTAGQIFCAAYILYARYVDPFTGAACEIETTIERLIALRAAAERGRGLYAAAGFGLMKHGSARTLVYSPMGEVKFHLRVSRASAVARRRGGKVLIWAGRESKRVSKILAAAGAPVVRMEDGFIRSRGLGSDYHPAASAVLDEVGVYYDATRPSGLERILQTHEFDAALLARAAALRARLVSLGLSKYNLTGARAAQDWPEGRRRLLVVGQVEADKSILWGCENVSTNLALLAAARRDHPDAFLLYKPHPDVEAGYRPGAVAAADVERLADAVAVEADIIACLEACEELATMTSLAGFEALLRGKRVHTYGRPFYAGWGLTHDALATLRRTRRLTLDELAAGALILYPVYVDPGTGLPCEVERVVEALAARPPIGPRMPTARRVLRAITQALAAKTRARY